MNLFLPILTDWFDTRHFYGVCVYRRPNGKRVAIGAETQEDFVRLLKRHYIPFTALPSDEWADAMQIGSAVTLKEAMQLLE